MERHSRATHLLGSLPLSDGCQSLIRKEALPEIEELLQSWPGLGSSAPNIHVHLHKSHRTLELASTKVGMYGLQCIKRGRNLDCMVQSKKSDTNLWKIAREEGCVRLPHILDDAVHQVQAIELIRCRALHNHKVVRNPYRCRTLQARRAHAKSTVRMFQMQAAAEKNC